MLVEHLTISADDRPGIVSEGIVEEPVRSRKHTPRTLGPITRAFCIHLTYLEDLAKMRRFKPAALEVSIKQATAGETTQEQPEPQGVAIWPSGLSRLYSLGRGDFGRRRGHCA